MLGDVPLTSMITPAAGVGRGCEDGVNGAYFRLAEGSPHGAFVHRVHGRTPWAVKNTGKLVKLRHAADHSAERKHHVAFRNATTQQQQDLFMCRVHVCALPVVLWCMFVSEQLQIDGLRSSLHAPVLKEKKHFNHSIIGGWCLIENLLSICWRKK